MTDSFRDGFPLPLVLVVWGVLLVIVSLMQPTAVREDAGGAVTLFQGLACTSVLLGYFVGLELGRRIGSPPRLWLSLLFALVISIPLALWLTHRVNNAGWDFSYWDPVFVLVVLSGMIIPIWGETQE